MDNNYQLTVLVPEGMEPFQAVTENIADWWTTGFSGESRMEGDEFAVRFGNTVKTFVVEDVVPKEKVVWKCLESYIDHAALSNHSEWTGTRIIWEFAPAEHGYSITLTHEGLTPALECYTICERGWEHSVKEGLHEFLSHGKTLQ